MRHTVALALILLGFGGFMGTQILPTASASIHHAATLTIRNTIAPISARYLSRAINAAAEDGAQFVIVFLNTPGGLLTSTRNIVETIQTSDVPIVVYIYPPGAQAASAGTFITAAASLAAMAPSTNIGAASPVGSGGEDLPTTLGSKANEDAAAFIRSIAEYRGRNVKALEETVLNATSYSASEALDNNVIDIIANDVDDLLAQLDGRLVNVQGLNVILETRGLKLQEIERTPVERFLRLLANPDIAFLLLTIGCLGIMMELLAPGLIVSGVGGAIALALAFIALGNLPVNWAGAGILMLGMVFFFLELRGPGIGVFGVGGAIGFILGTFLLFGEFSSPAISTPSFDVSLWMIGTVSVILFGFLVFLFRVILHARSQKYLSSVERLVGQTGTAATWMEPHGSIQVAGERWSGISDSGEPISKGEEVIVLGVQGLTLKVVKAPKVNE